MNDEIKPSSNEDLSKKKKMKQEFDVEELIKDIDSSLNEFDEIHKKYKNKFQKY